MLKFIRDFKSPGRRHPFFCFFLFLLFLLLVSQLSFSRFQKPYPRIKKVTIKVDGQSKGDDIEEMISIKEGELFSLKKITNSIKQIYKIGLFSDIQVLKEGEQEIHLTYLLTKKLFTRKIFFPSKQKISHKKLKESIYSLNERDAFSQEKLEKAFQELKEALRKEGYFSPEIEISLDRYPKTSSVDVFFEIRSAKRFVIKKIAFSGEVLLSETELKKEMKSKEGEVYIPSVLEQDISRLKEVYNSMNYQRVEIKGEEIDFDEKKGTVSLTLKITPHEKIEIVVKGAKVPLALLKPIWEERIFEEWGLNEGEAKIIGYLRKKGYIFSSVTSFIERGENEMRIVYQVTPGESYKVGDISFEGLAYFTPSQLKKELEIKEKIPFFSSIDGARLFELPPEIKALYESQGFLQTQVDLNFIKQGKKVKPVYYIEEGNQEKIEKISIEGMYLFTPEILLGQIGSFQGGPFYQPNIQKDIEKLGNFYLNQGVRRTEINAQVKKISDGFFSVVFNIREGKKIKIEKVVITGNVATKRSTILRELKIKEGDYALYESIRETKRRLERLGIFTEVNIEEIPQSPVTENLVISLREGHRNYISLGVGLETKNEPQTYSVWNNVIRPRVTAEFIRSNIFGSAAQFSFVTQASLKEKRGVLSWEQPYFFGLPLQTYLNAWLEREERKSFSYDRRGVSLTAIKSASQNRLFLATLRWARTMLFNLRIAESEVDRQHFPFSASSVSGSFIWDRRDDPFNPEKGSFFSFVLEWAYPLFRSESDYLKNFIKYQHFHPLFPSVTFSSTARLGFGKGRMPIHERFFAGGSNSFRGEEFDELGPKDPDSLNPIGGKALFLLNFELTFPLLSTFKDLFGAVFYDKGNVFPKRKDFSLASLQDTVGVGLRYRTPLGPIRLELGWNLDAVEGERKILAFITIGNVF